MELRLMDLLLSMRMVIWEPEEKGKACERARLICWLLWDAGCDCRIDQIGHLWFGSMVRTYLIRYFSCTW